MSRTALSLSGLPVGHRLPDLQSKSPPHGRRNSVADLPVFVQNRPVELVEVLESLTAGTLAY